MFFNFINVQYCYDYLIGQIPVGLLLYSHIPTALLALLFSGYVLLKVRDKSSIALFVVCVSFAVWCLFDIASWFSFLGSSSTMFTWSLLDLVALIMFFFSYYFLYSFITKKDLPGWQKITSILLLLPTAIWTFLGSNLSLYDLNTCEAVENDTFARYPYFVEVVFIISCLVFLIIQYRRTKDISFKKEILLMGSGVTSFLLFFFSSTFLVNLLAASEVSTYVYNYEIYGLFGMPVLLIFLGYLVVKYKAFNLKVFGAQALILSLIALVGSQFFFIQNNTNRILTGITLLITGIIGINLIRSVKKEVEQREKIEKLVGELSVSNDKLQEVNQGQSSLIHFMNHQIKGRFGNIKNIFAELTGDDYGVMPPETIPLLKKGLDEANIGVGYVTAILRGASAENGTLQYEMKSVDLKNIVNDVAVVQRENAEKKGLKFNLNVADGDYIISADSIQLGEAIKNLIDNSINYTPTGSVSVDLSQTDKKILFKVTDTGVGITPEDRARLFKAGGRGVNSLKVNVNATGYGLVFVRGVAEAHKGRVWVESAGHDKGSTFYLELPKA
jgi:signal transduction histidine kinase